MSQYSDAHSATINFLSQFDSISRLKDTLGKAKEAEDFIAKSDSVVKAHKAEVDKLKADKQTLAAEISDLKTDKDEVRKAALKRLDDEIEEKRQRAAADAMNAEGLAGLRLTSIEERIISAKAIAVKSDIDAKAAQVRLGEVNSALASAERDRKEAIAALQM